MTDWRSRLLELASDVEDAFDRRWDAFERRFGLDEPLRIVPYRGYQAPGRLVLRGRVLEEKTHPEPPADRDSVWDNLLRWFDRVATDEVPGARVVARLGEEEHEATAGDEGFFELDLERRSDPEEELAWREVGLECLEPVKEDEPARATGRVVVPGAGAGLAIVSDLDDTVIHTGATSQLRMARVIFLNNARSRSPFPGVGAFYRALQAGPGGRPLNPLFYVSSSPWNYYPLFDHFLEFHDIPPGPIFLKDFGLEEDRLFKSGHEEHKRERIEALLDDYPELEFVLIGDSGQKDPETYLQVIEDHPGRIRAAYLRDVTPDERDAEVRKIAERAAGHGVEMVLTESTADAAHHAAEHGLVPEAAVEEIAADADREERDGGRSTAQPP